MNILSKLVCLFSLLYLITSCNTTSGVTSLSLSSDGQYVITAHKQGELVLWDIAKKSKKILSKEANINSAYFIPDSHEFMWQDKNNIVHIQDVTGREIKQFSHFETEGHQMTADKSFYLSADKWGKLYKGYGDNLVPIYTDNPIGGFKPYSLSIWGNYILSANSTVSDKYDPPAETNLTVNPINPNEHKKSSYNGVTLWDKTTLKPIARLWGDQGPTVGTISPDGKWIVTGSNRSKQMWSIENLNHKIKFIDITGAWNEQKGGLDTSNVLPKPEKFKDKIYYLTVNVSAIVFVTEKEFIMFSKDYENELALLYTTGDRWIQAYVEIGKGVSVRNLSIASAPKAHIVATGQYEKGGINVYRYHPESKELEKIWEAD